MNLPLSKSEALAHLTDALGANYGGDTNEAVLVRALGVDSVADKAGALYRRPWATARRLIADNTEYEVSDGLTAQINRKLAGLDRTQRGMDLAQGISALVPNPFQQLTASGPVSTQGNY